jgi:hypothetical protein
VSPAPRIGRPRSLEEREQDRIAEEVERRETALDQIALSKNAPTPTPEPAAEAEVAVLDPLAEATARHREAEAKLAAAEVEVAEADAALVQVKADHAAARAEQTLQHHRAILQPALAAAQRQEAAFLKLWQQYGGAGRGGVTHGPLARYAKTIPSGDERRRTRLMELYKQAGQLMETIRVGYQAAHRSVEATRTALERLSMSDASDFRFDQAGRACEEAAVYIAANVEVACVKLLSDVKAVDGEPGAPSDEFIHYLAGQSREAVKKQTRAEGVGDPGILA